MGKSEVYLTSFDVSPVEYFDLMLDTVVQQEIHTSKDGLNMSVWRASDGPLLGVPNGTSRVVFSEPDLKVPKFLKKWVQKAQSYNEYSDFYPPSLGDDGDGDDVYGVLHGARGIDRAKSEMFSSLGSFRGSESADNREQDGTVDTEHESRKSGRTRRVRETDVREE